MSIASQTPLAALADYEQELESYAPYGIILVDWRMPSIDGIEVSKRINAFAQTKDKTPPGIFMINAHGLKEASVRPTSLAWPGSL